MMRLLGVAMLVAVLTIVITWPQATHISSAIFSHHDAYFSIWRLAWIAHALPTAPRHLFDANIFYPATNTLAFSDATLLQGVIAAPLFWAGLSPVLIYNLLFLVGFVGSGVAMFVLSRYLTGATGPSIVAAAVFTMAPYRMEHAMHLELQWAMWIPLAFWAFHRAVDEGSWRFGVVAGLFIWLQIISCVYYGVFLLMILVAFTPILAVVSRHRLSRIVPAVMCAMLVAGVLALPYALQYLDASRNLGGRNLGEIAEYSARPINYLSAPSLNVLWGWTADRWGSRELRLFPGVVAVLIACLAVFHRSRRWTWLYLIVALVAVEVSFGVNGVVYRTLAERLTLLQGFRSTARIAIVASAGLAVLAGLGTQVLIDWIPRGKRWRAAVIPLIVAVMTLESANRPLPLTAETIGTPAPIYKMIRSAGPGVMIELPLPTPDRLPGWDPFYASWSITHWNPLVNGYSGYHPQDYLQTLVRMQNFPDDASIGRLRGHNVHYIVIHQAFYEPEQYTRLMLRMAVRPEFRPFGGYRDPVGNAELFVLEQ